MNTKNMRKKVRVTIVKEFEVDLSKTLGSMTEEKFLHAWSSSLWDVNSIDDVFKHAAEMAADGMCGYNLDGLGLLGTEDKCDTKIEELYDEVESEIIDDWDM